MGSAASPPVPSYCIRSETSAWAPRMRSSCLASHTVPVWRIDSHCTGATSPPSPGWWHLRRSHKCKAPAAKSTTVPLTRCRLLCFHPREHDSKTVPLTGCRRQLRELKKMIYTRAERSLYGRSRKNDKETLRQWRRRWCDTHTATILKFIKSVREYNNPRPPVMQEVCSWACRCAGVCDSPPNGQETTDVFDYLVTQCAGDTQTQWISAQWMWFLGLCKLPPTPTSSLKKDVCVGGFSGNAVGTDIKLQTRETIVITEIPGFKERLADEV